MATAAAAHKPEVVEATLRWVGQDRAGKTVRGEMQASGEAQVNAVLRRQGIKVDEVKKQRLGRGGTISEKDITLFTRQLATMMKSGVPLLQTRFAARFVVTSSHRSLQALCPAGPIPYHRHDRESLCLVEALPRRVRHRLPPEPALPDPHHSYRLMRQTRSLLWT